MFNDNENVMLGWNFLAAALVSHSELLLLHNAALSLSANVIKLSSPSNLTG